MKACNNIKILLLLEEIHLFNYSIWYPYKEVGESLKLLKTFVLNEAAVCRKVSIKRKALSLIYIMWDLKMAVNLINFNFVFMIIYGDTSQKKLRQVKLGLNQRPF